MKTVLFILQKEFKQIFRNKSMLPLILVMPIMQLLVLPLAADFEVRNILVGIVDHDHSTYSQKLISRIGGSSYFKMAGYYASYREAVQAIERDHADVVLEIPAGFERNLVREKHQQLLLAVNAINGTKANVGGTYLAQIVSAFNEDVRLAWQPAEHYPQQASIDIIPANWFNPMMNFRLFIVPGILAILVTMVASYLTALNIVKEKEIGTIEQINVTPIRKHHFILGKLIPFWILGMVLFTIGLFVIARLVYGIVPQGSIVVLYAFLSIYLIAILGFGLLVSTFAETQQQAMSVAFFFVMIFLLMSGLFTPVDSMPEWAKTIAWCSPVTYFIDVMRLVVLKGSGFAEVAMHFAVISGLAILLMGWAILNYKKTT